jgi:hypothetical protein
MRALKGRKRMLCEPLIHTPFIRERSNWVMGRTGRGTPTRQSAKRGVSETLDENKCAQQLQGPTLCGYVGSMRGSLYHSRFPWVNLGFE